MNLIPKMVWILNLILRLMKIKLINYYERVMTQFDEIQRLRKPRVPIPQPIHLTYISNLLTEQL